MVTTILTGSHADGVRFAEHQIELQEETVAAHRDQANRVRAKVHRFVEDHPDYGLIKFLLFGSSAKGAAFAGLNAIDLAVDKSDFAQSQRRCLWGDSQSRSGRRGRGLPNVDAMRRAIETAKVPRVRVE